MKEYTVYYIIKKNNHGYLCSETVKDKNIKLAIAQVKRHVREDTGHNAFTPTTRPPQQHPDGILFNDLIYTLASGNRLW